jgi:antitoxin HicB
MGIESAVLPRFEVRPLSAAEGGGYLLEFPDYPGCIADGETPEEAIREARDALASYLATLEELGGEKPSGPPQSR